MPIITHESTPTGPLLPGNDMPIDGNLVSYCSDGLASLPRGGDTAAGASARLEALALEVRGLRFSAGTVALHSFLGACSVVALPVELLAALERAVIAAKRYDFAK